MLQSRLHAKDLPHSVQKMQDFSLTGNIVPMHWFQSITFDNGKPDTNSILILSDIVYWYRPTEVRDERSGAIVGYKKKFAEDLLKRSYSDLEAHFGISKKQCQESLRRLEEKGIIKRIFRTLDTAAGRQNNVMYIYLDPDVLKTFTHPELKSYFSSSVTDDCKEASKTEDTPYGDQTPHLWNSNSIPMENKFHTYGDLSPHHIKDTNTTSEISSKTTLSQETALSSSELDEREIASQMLSIWNELLPQKALPNLSKFLASQLETSYREGLNESMDLWNTVCQNFKSSKFLMGEAEGVRIKPDLSWLLDPRKPHLHNVLHKAHYTYDDRANVSKNKPKTAEDLELEIMSSNDSLELKTIKRDILNLSPVIYLACLRHARFELDENNLAINFPTSWAREHVSENNLPQIIDLVRNKYKRSLTLTVEPQKDIRVVDKTH